jgi:hypothetical protein
MKPPSSRKGAATRAGKVRKGATSYMEWVDELFHALGISTPDDAGIDPPRPIKFFDACNAAAPASRRRLALAFTFSGATGGIFAACHFVEVTLLRRESPEAIGDRETNL